MSPEALELRRTRDMLHRRRDDAASGLSRVRPWLAGGVVVLLVVLLGVREFRRALAEQAAVRALIHAPDVSEFLSVGTH